MELITNLISGVLGGVWGYVVAGAGVVVAFLGAYFKGRSDAKKKAKTEQLERYQGTRKDMDDAEIFDDPGVAREFLRNRKP